VIKRSDKMGRYKMYTKEMKRFMLIAPAEVIEKAHKKGNAEGRSTSNVISKILEDFFKRGK
jgi:hypothetical protein